MGGAEPTVRLRLGTRASPLAMAQARLAAAAIEAANGWPAGSVALAPMTTSGDRIQDRPLAEVGGKALWTKELDRALLAGETDASVHSMKDVESERPDALSIAAVLPRADVRDRLIGADSIAALARGATVGTSSPRRAAQLRARRPDLAIIPFRGNVATRLQRIADGEADATLLAAAGLDRLGIQAGSAVPLEEMLPAPAQAAIGIECRTGDPAMIALARVDDPAAGTAVALERAFACALGGSCHSPVAALAVVRDGHVQLDAEIWSEDGSDHCRGSAALAADDLAGAAELARQLLADAPPGIARLFDPR